jgi:hypothetical protein
LYDAVRGLEHPFVHHTSLVGAVAPVTCVSIERAGEATASWHYLILPVSRAHFVTASVTHTRIPRKIATGSGKVVFVFAILSTR